MANINKTVKLGVFTLAIMNVTAVVSLRGLPAEAVYGLSSAFCRMHDAFRVVDEIGVVGQVGFRIRGNRILNPDLFGGSGISGNVPRQTRWCIPLGR